MKIRKAMIGDLKEIQELNLMLFEKEHKEYDKLLDLNWTFGNEGTSHFKDAIKKEDSCAFVVEEDAKIIGYLVGSEVEGESYRQLPKMAEIDNMLVLSEWREKGAGRILYDAFVKWCKERGVRRTRVEATAQNKDAIKFYRKMGMKDYTLVLEGEL